MRDFESSTLWHVSAYEHMRQATGASGFKGADSVSALPSSFLGELRRVEKGAGGSDVLEVMAACMRQREAALLYLQHEGCVWPVTIFPDSNQYHSPRILGLATQRGLSDLTLIQVESPGVRPPGHWMHERVGAARNYHDLTPLLWSVALFGPRGRLLEELSGTAAFRALRNPTDHGLHAGGALGPSIDRLRRESVAMRDIAAWSGMSPERASRLLNGLYLDSSLMVTRHHPAARSEQGLLRSLFSPRSKRH